MDIQLWYAKLPTFSQFLVLLFCFLAALQIGYHVYLISTRILRNLKLLTRSILFFLGLWIRSKFKQRTPLSEMTLHSSDFLTQLDLCEDAPLSEKPSTLKAHHSRTQHRNAKGQFVKQK